VVSLGLILESTSGYPLFGEGGMVKDPSRVGVDTIPKWKEPCWEG
jgi:hypothetical protein